MGGPVAPVCRVSPVNPLRPVNPVTPFNPFNPVRPVNPPIWSTRRRWLGWLGAASVSLVGPAFGSSAAGRPGASGASEPLRFAAAWRDDSGERIGLLAHDSGEWRIESSIRVPTRAHGIVAEGAGRFLAIARRPGDWLLRWDASGRERGWSWTESGRALNGHLVASADGRTLFTTETDLDTGAGLIGVRDAASLEKVDEWSTAGLDPHELVFDEAGRLLIANGGIPTLPETGRLKIGLDRMDASLVRLDGDTGELLGQWRLADRRLSLRHLAWAGDRLGIALQAEHESADARASAPVLARFDGERLDVCAGAPLAGYGGDIVAVDGGWAVSCPRARAVALWDRDGRPVGRLALDEACALASSDGRLWIGGRPDSLRRDADGRLATSRLPPFQLDNHWVAVSPELAGPEAAGPTGARTDGATPEGGAPRGIGPKVAGRGDREAPAAGSRRRS